MAGIIVDGLFVVAGYCLLPFLGNQLFWVFLKECPIYLIAQKLKNSQRTY
jgi:ABC-type bacteriocin/lantibiotic exporter with double-glycine peptidase domain